MEKRGFKVHEGGMKTFGEFFLDTKNFIEVDLHEDARASDLLQPSKLHSPFMPLGNVSLNNNSYNFNADDFGIYNNVSANEFFKHSTLLPDCDNTSRLEKIFNKFKRLTERVRL